MNLIVYQMMQLQVMHVSDCGRAVKRLTCPTVTELNLSVAADRNALPERPVISVIGQILHNLRQEDILVFLIEIIPLAVHVVVCKLKGILDIHLIRAVEYRRGDIEAKCHRGKTQMDLQNLSDVHTGRYAQRVQNDIERTSVRQERHILDWKHAGYDTFVSVTSGHLVTDRNLSLLRNVDTNRLVHTGGQLIAVFSGEYPGIHNNTVLAVRNLQRGVTDFSCLFSENRTKQTLLGGQLGLSLRSYLSDEDISGTYLRTDADNAALIQILQRIIADTGNILCDLLRSELGVAGLALVLFDMDGGVHVITHQTL